MTFEFTKSEIDFLAESIKHDLLLSNLHVLESSRLSELAKYDNFSLVKNYLQEAAEDDKEKEKSEEKDKKQIEEIKKQYTSIGSQMKLAGVAVSNQFKALIQAETVRSALSRGNAYVGAIMKQSKTNLIAKAAKFGISATIAGAAHTVAATIFSIIATALITMAAAAAFRVAWALAKTIMRGVANIVRRFVNTIRGKRDPEEARKEMKQMMGRTKTALNTTKRLVRVVPGKKGKKLLNRINKLDERLSR